MHIPKGPPLSALRLSLGKDFAAKSGEQPVGASSMEATPQVFQGFLRLQPKLERDAAKYSPSGNTKKIILHRTFLRNWLGPPTA